MKRIAVLTLFLLSILNFVNAKTSKKLVEQKFPKDSTEFLDEFTKFMEQNISDEDEILLDEFVLFWEMNKISNERKERVIDICNLMDKRRAQPYPHFGNYLKNILSYSYKDTLQPVYDIWEESFLKLLNNRKISLNQISRYLSISWEFIQNRTLFISRGLNWKFEKIPFELKLEDHLMVYFNDQTDLTCYSKSDSVSIYNTKGVFNLFTSEWKGKYGLVTWERAGYSRDSVYAKLRKYQINMTTYAFKADSVTFINKFYLSQPAFGKLEDRVMNIQKPSLASYPKFESYDNYFKIDDLFENVNYEGGLSVQGARTIGSSTGNTKASLKILRNDTVFINLYAKNFIFYRNMVRSEFTETAIYFKEDSIYHPSINCTYSGDSKEVSLFSSSDILSQAPYNNSYHKINISAPEVSWKQGSNYLFLSMAKGASQGITNFKSYNFFNEWQHDKLRGMDFEHPLQAIYNYYRSIGSEVFHADNLARFVRKTRGETYQWLMMMNYYGYVVYNRETKIATINPNLYNALKARVHLVDYDVINFISEVQTPDYNARLDLDNFDLNIHGIPRVSVSDSQNVVIIPKGGEITFRKNRNFKFDGIMYAGLFQFYGAGFEFDYDKFSVEMPLIDSLRFSVQEEEKDMYGKSLLSKVNNTIENIAGNLLIDQPDNKSGLKNNPEYPIFNSKKNSFIYYDDPSIWGGVYNRENFYFEIYPYTIDSLDNFNKTNLNFAGMLYSAEIFAPIQEKVVLREDNSMGFVRNTSDNGVPVYEGKGTFHETIDLSNRGLRASGKVDFITSETKSEDFYFFPDSMNTESQEFNITAKYSGIEYPKVNSKNNSIHWLPKKEEMFISQSDTRFNMFNDSTNLNGKLRLNPVGLSGNGRMQIGKALMNSTLFEYEAVKFNSDSSDFKVLAVEKDQFKFISDDIKLKIDFSKQLGEFKNREKTINLQLPQNQYLAFAQQYKWEMNVNNIEISQSTKEMVIEKGIQKWVEKEQKDDAPIGASFVSTHYQQDSLYYISPETDFDLNHLVIYSHRVKYLDVADARILPYESEITVYRDANMKSLEDAEVLANRETKYHRFYKSKIKVLGRKKYYGEGDFDYLDENRRKQVVHFDSIYVDKSIQTIAEGSIVEPDNFTLNPKFQYLGDVTLNARDRFLVFDGGTKLLHLCDTLPRYWVKFKTRINPDSIYIPVNDEVLEINRNRIFAGSYVAPDSIHIYPTFFSKRTDYHHAQVVHATGFLHYDKNSDKFKVGSKEKIHNPNLPEPYVNLNSSFCYMHSEGKLNIGINTGRLELNPIGSAGHDVNKNELKLDMMMPMDFLFPKRALDIFAHDVDSILRVNNAKKVDVHTKTFEKNLKLLLDTANVDKYLNDLKKFGAYEKMPRKLKHTIFISDLKLKWYQETKTYYSEGKVGIFSIGDKFINRYVDAKVELWKRNTGDRMHIYIKLNDDNWYLFAYYPGILQTLSSNKEYATVIKGLKSKERKIKASKGKPSFNFLLMTETKRIQTLNRFKVYEQMKERAKEAAEEAKRQKEEAKRLKEEAAKKEKEALKKVNEVAVPVKKEEEKEE